MSPYPALEPLPQRLFFNTLPTGEVEFSCFVRVSPPSRLDDTWLEWSIAGPDQQTHLRCERVLTPTEQDAGRVWLTATLPSAWPTSQLQVTLHTPEARMQGTWPVTHYQPPLMPQLPLAGTSLVLIGHRIGETHRAAWQIPAQQFAWDLLPLGAEGLHLLRGPLTEPLPVALFTGFGQAVLAPAPGRVIEVVDEYPDGKQVGSYPHELAFYLEKLRRAAGNYVILDHGGGVYSCLAHLQHHSVCVQAQQEVGVGQEVGKLGNSGFSSGPHLHLHFMDGPDLLQASPLPMAVQAEGSVIDPQAGQIISS